MVQKFKGINFIQLQAPADIYYGQREFLFQETYHISQTNNLTHYLLIKLNFFFLGGNQQNRKEKDRKTRMVLYMRPMHHIKCDRDISHSPHACRHTCRTWTLHMLKAHTFFNVLVDYYYSFLLYSAINFKKCMFYISFFSFFGGWVG